jgi:hypothetical protein
MWLVTAALKVNPLTGTGPLDQSVDMIYRHWYATLSTGSFPFPDPSWQYPPGAALPLLAPGLLPGLGYGRAFVLLCAVCDAAVTAALLYAAVRRGCSTDGAWLWIVGLAALSTIPWNRYDVFVTAVAMAALCCPRRPRRPPWTFGSLAALGALVKVWPVLLLTGTPPGRRTRAAWGAAVVTALATVALFGLLMPHAFAFLTAQRERGIQIESVGSLPFHIARHFGWSGTWEARDGSHEFVGPYVVWADRACLVLSAAALGWLMWWRYRSDRTAPWVLPDAALTAVLLFVVTSRVLSPQYLVWLVGLAAVCGLRTRSTQRPVVWLVLAACAFTTLEFPLGYRALRDEAAPLAIAVLYVRDLLLVAAAAVSAVRLWRATVPRRDRARSGGGIAELGGAERLPVPRPLARDR